MNGLFDELDVAAFPLIVAFGSVAPEFTVDDAFEDPVSLISAFYMASGFAVA